TAPGDPRWLDAAGGHRVWPVDNYQREGPRMTQWLGTRAVKQHRTLGTLVNLVLDAGFMLSRVVDWGPSDAELAAKPDLAEERERPTFLLVAARRP
ncbi:MAG: SAM-dependent methyltransferase, partial [Stellaceae bacterium]